MNYVEERSKLNGGSSSKNSMVNNNPTKVGKDPKKNRDNRDSRYSRSRSLERKNSRRSPSRDRERERERRKKRKGSKSPSQGKNRSRSKSKKRERSRDRSREKKKSQAYKYRGSSSNERPKVKLEKEDSYTKSKFSAVPVSSSNLESFSKSKFSDSKFSDSAPNSQMDMVPSLPQLVQTNSNNGLGTNSNGNIANTTNNGANSASQSMQALAIAQAAKVDRKLYIGNLPTGITPSTLVKLLNAALIALNPKVPGDPVLSAWISTDGHYAFVEFRSSEEANNGFVLNNISILGQPLKVGRPKTYVGALSMLDDGNVCNTVAAALQAGTMNAPLLGRKVQFPTRILVFKKLLTRIDVLDDEEYLEICDDIKEECMKYGRVMSINIPRDDPGVGNVYVEFYTLEEAKEGRRQLTGRKFMKRTANIVYFPEEKYAKKEFELPKEETVNL